jgi:hypothetical protein
LRRFIAARGEYHGVASERYAVWFVKHSAVWQYSSQQAGFLLLRHLMAGQEDHFRYGRFVLAHDKSSLVMPIGLRPAGVVFVTHLSQILLAAQRIWLRGCRRSVDVLLDARYTICQALGVL